MIPIKRIKQCKKDIIVNKNTSCLPGRTQLVYLLFIVIFNFIIGCNVYLLYYVTVC